MTESKLLDWLSDNRRSVGMLGMALALFVLWAVFFAGWFKTDTIEIVYRLQPARQRGGQPILVFNLGRDYQLNTVRAVALDDDGEENEIVWHLERDEDDRDVDTFRYGARLPGMVAVDDLPTRRLESGKRYRLFLRADGARGVVDFEIDPTRVFSPRARRG